MMGCLMTEKGPVVPEWGLKPSNMIMGRSDGMLRLRMQNKMRLLCVVVMMMVVEDLDVVRFIDENDPSGFGTDGNE